MKTSILSILCMALWISPAMSEDQDDVQPENRSNRVRSEQDDVDRPQNSRVEERRERRDERQEERQDERMARANNVNQQLATWLATCNKSEIELSKFAVDKASNDQVKQFAKMIHDDHQQLQEKLKKFTQQDNAERVRETADELSAIGTGEDAAEDKGTTLPETDRPEDPGRNAQGRRITQTAERIVTGVRTAVGTSRGNIMEQVGEEASQNALKMTKDLLSKKQGQNFDMGYLGHQLVAHIQMISTMKAMQNHADGEFADLLTDGIAKTENHLEKAKTLAGQIQDNEGR